DADTDRSWSAGRFAGRSGLHDDHEQRERVYIDERQSRRQRQADDRTESEHLAEREVAVVCAAVCEHGDREQRVYSEPPTAQAEVFIRLDAGLGDVHSEWTSDTDQRAYRISDLDQDGDQHEPADIERPDQHGALP